MKAPRFSSSTNASRIAWGISVALTPMCIAEPAHAQKVALENGIETLWEGTTSALLGPSTGNGASPSAKTARRRAAQKKAVTRRKRLARKRAIARRKRLALQKRSAARRKAAQRARRLSQTQHIQGGTVLLVPLPQQKLLAKVSSEMTAQNEISQPSVDEMLQTEQTAIGKKRSDEVDCKRFIPTASMNISVPCSF
jgi:hypothetical protein